MKIFCFALLFITLCYNGASLELKATALDICSLPSETGRCRAAFRRWFFNSATGQCEQFIYGGCGGNGNNFQSLEECEARCDTCSLPSKTGLCKAYFPRWFFNSATGECERFIYGGCGANSNNFKTKQECEQRCDLCELPSKPGPCRASIPSWFYNSESGQCEEFIYGGCQGNANRFSSKIACEKRCAVKVDVCTLPVEPGPCRGSFPRWYFDSATGQCKRFIYGGCQGNGNRFETVGECNAACGDVCSLPVKPGPCRGSFPRHYFNGKTGKCERFIYGGCQGNANNFNSEDDCARRCSICDYPKEVGPCEALIRRWFFNKDTNKCEMFNYGGCQGNANNFENQKECESSCRCMRPRDIGPCDGVFPKYYYNNGQCQLFDYGGCEGNGNRFDTKSKCLSVCSTCKPVDCDNTYCPNGLKKDKNGCINKKCQCVCKCKGNKCKQEQCTGPKCNVCQLPPDSGCGNKKAMRWFYDASNSRCSQFRYSGNAGNGNNFKSKVECLKACWVTADKYLKDTSVIAKLDN